VVDETVHLWDTVYVSGGRRGLDVEVAPVDLVEVTGAIVADISRW
jgi:Cys-tRNA(Pro)/Cys-tRNA(Cys) deacylase